MLTKVAIPTIETKNYRLRAMTLEDVEDMYVFMKDRETMKYITPNPVESVQDLRRNMEGYLEKFKQGKEIPWVIIHKASGELIGQFRLHKLNKWHKKAEMGVVIRKDFQNQGVMTEVIEKVLEFSFNALDLNRIVGDIFAGNQGSRRLLEKYGFTKEGVLRQTDFDGEMYHDTVVYSLLKEEYDQQNNNAM
ncbi:ribosomal-protein-alanine N-acetyltransferase [Oceanobacillus limi]|uniref:Ribosomal-protein-alanine N-acetyltransferase n=1 Tax=Oceanobacillus limi TaxID=930131 RepID=A0A1I0F873_9BACI|nr:GNAT family N-acetyltransferase [Oceanobacillus limi]SET54101.1 ribosomal-protein-alanine N-acetyltransferase [Oceanobacillus limi]